MLQVEQLCCRYENRHVVESISFDLVEGTLACLLGPSGCGKTTVLRAIAGFQNLSGGTISLNNQCISSSDGNVPPEKRNLSMVFQDHALFPHLTVANNIAAGLHNRSKSEIKDTVSEMMDYVRLQDLNHRFPHELSGGQQQRVALARALAPKPRLILMDEPFSNLDQELRVSLGHEVRELLKKIGTTAILVTHDQLDAFTFSDFVGVMNDGEIDQWDTPYNLYHEPQTKFVADFVGDGVFLDVTILDEKSIACEIGELHGETPDGSVPGSKFQLLVRPDDIIHDDESKMTAKIRKKAFRGESYLYTLELPSGNEILSLVPSHHNHAIGEDLGIRLEIDHLVFFDHQS